MKPTLQTVAADIARRIPAMKTDSSLNNEQLIAGMIEPLLDAEDEADEANEAEVVSKCFYGGIIFGFFIAAVVVTAVAIFTGK